VFILRNSLFVSIQVRMHAVKDRKDVEKEEHLPWSRKSVIRGLEERHPWSRRASSVVYNRVICGLEERHPWSRRTSSVV